MKIRLFIMADLTSKQIDKEYYFNHLYARYPLRVLSIAPHYPASPLTAGNSRKALKARQRNPGKAVSHIQ